MNETIQNNYDMLLQTQAMRDQLLDIITDADLTHRLGGDTLSLGEVFKELGEIQHSYTQSFVTLTQNFDYRTLEVGLETSVAKLKAWFVVLDAEMKAVLETITGDEIIQRGFAIPAGIQLMIYREAVLIVATKASIYLRSLKKPLPKQVKDWVD